jgi:hypothetical protein
MPDPAAALAAGSLGAAVLATVLLCRSRWSCRAQPAPRRRERAEDVAVAQRRAAGERANADLAARQAALRVRTELIEAERLVVDDWTPRARVLTPEQRSLDHDVRLLEQVGTLTYDPTVWER